MGYISVFGSFSVEVIIILVIRSKQCKSRNAFGRISVFLNTVNSMLSRGHVQWVTWQRVLENGGEFVAPVSHLSWRLAFKVDGILDFPFVVAHHACLFSTSQSPHWLEDLLSKKVLQATGVRKGSIFGGHALLKNKSDFKVLKTGRSSSAFRPKRGCGSGSLVWRLDERLCWTNRIASCSWLDVRIYSLMSYMYVNNRSLRLTSTAENVLFINGPQSYFNLDAFDHFTEFTFYS